MSNMPTVHRVRPALRALMVAAAFLSGLVTAYAQSDPPPKAAAPAPADTASTAVVKKQTEWFFNSPASPLAIERREMPKNLQANFGRTSWLGLANRSSQRIVRYDVGCVIENQGRVKVLNTLFWVAISEGGTAPGHFSPGIFRHGDPAQDEQDSSRACKGSRLAVVLVGFGDGSIWTANGSVWYERQGGQQDGTTP
jgi:hypothetical protein